MLLRALRGELLKGRRNPVWLVFLVLPLFPAVLGTMNYLGNVSVLTDGWYSLWTQHTLFSASLFLPAQFGVFCAWQWRLEHSGSNWNACRSAPISAGALYGSKFLLAVFVSALAQVCIGGLYVLGGRLAGLTGPVPAELVSWLLGGFVGGEKPCVG